jgi:CBS domain-containing protein
VTTVREIMDPEPPTARPEDDAESVIRLMRKHELSGVAVVNEGGRPVGIVTESDLVIADDEGDLHLPHYIELMGGVIYLEPVRRFEERLRKAFASRVRDMMTEDPVTIEADAPVEQAAHLIATRKHNRIPVVEHGRLVGMITRADVLEALHGEPSTAA